MPKTISSTSRTESAKKLASAIESNQASIVVVGMGPVGQMQAKLISREGFDVIGYDRNEELITKLCDKRISHSTCKLSPTYSADSAILAQADIIVICIRVHLSDDNEPQTDPLIGLAATIKSHRQANCLIVLVTTSPVGTTRTFSKKIGAQSDNSWFIAVAPERISMLQTENEVRSTPRVLSGIDQLSSDLCQMIIRKICIETKSVSDPETAELSKLLENAFRTHSIALIGEICRLSQAWSISATEVCDAAATKPFGYFPFHPGPGVGGHCLPNDLEILKSSFTSRGLSSELLKATGKAINNITQTAVAKLEKLLEGTVDSCSILLVGVGFKPGSADTSTTPASNFIEILISQGANVQYIDSLVKTYNVAGMTMHTITQEVMHSSRFDAVVILAGDSSIEIDALYSVSDIVLDTGGARTMPGDTSSLAYM